MSVQVVPRAWSHSALTSFEICPKRYWHLNIKKDYVEPQSEHQIWGNEVHQAIARRLKSAEPFPLGMKQFEPLIAPLADLPGKPLIEQKLALDVNFQPCGWFDDHVWCRVIIDAAFIRGARAILMDWKTGKRKEEDDQLALMAGVMFAQMPELEAIDSAFWWLQEKPSNAIAKTSFTRTDVPTIWGRFLRRVQVFQQSYHRGEYPATPSGICRKYCPVRSCPYHGG